MFQKAKDVVMTIGSSMIQKSKALYDGFINKVRDTSNKVLRSVGAGILGAGLVLSSPASAAVPAGVTTAITEAAADVAVVGGAVILVFIGIKVWKWLRAAF